MGNCKAWDIVRVPFPCTSRPVQQYRPALVRRCSGPESREGRSPGAFRRANSKNRDSRDQCRLAHRISRRGGPAKSRRKNPQTSASPRNLSSRSLGTGRSSFRPLKPSACDAWLSEVLWKTGCSTRDISIMALSRDQVTSPPRRMSCMTPPSGMGNGYFAKTGAVLSTVGHHWSLQTFPSFILPSYGRFSGF